MKLKILWLIYVEGNSDPVFSTHRHQRAINKYNDLSCGVYRGRKLTLKRIAGVEGNAAVPEDTDYDLYRLGARA